MRPMSGLEIRHQIVFSIPSGPHHTSCSDVGQVLQTASALCALSAPQRARERCPAGPTACALSEGVAANQQEAVAAAGDNPDSRLARYAA